MNTLKQLMAILLLSIIISCSKSNDATPAATTKQVPPIIKLTGSWNENSKTTFKLYTFYTGIDSAYYIQNVKTGNYSFNQKTLMLATSGWGGSANYYSVVVLDSNHFTAAIDTSYLKETLNFIRL